MRRKEDIRRAAIGQIVAQAQGEAIRRRMITLLVEVVRRYAIHRRRQSMPRPTHPGSALIH